MDGLRKKSRATEYRKRRRKMEEAAERDSDSDSSDNVEMEHSHAHRRYIDQTTEWKGTFLTDHSLTRNPPKKGSPHDLVGINQILENDVVAGSHTKASCLMNETASFLIKDLLEEQSMDISEDSCHSDVSSDSSPPPILRFNQRRFEEEESDDMSDSGLSEDYQGWDPRVDENPHTDESGSEKLARLHEILDDDEWHEQITVPFAASKAEIFLCVLKYSLKHRLTLTATSDLMKMLNSFFIRSFLPDTAHFLKLYFGSNVNIHLHAVCPKCKVIVGEFKLGEHHVHCNICDKDIVVSDPSFNNFYAIVDCEDQVAALIEENKEYFLNIMNEAPGDGTVFKDITDGDLHGQLRRSLPPEIRKRFATATFNNDSAPAFESSKFSITPYQFVINELPPDVRVANPITCALYFGKDKPEENAYTLAFVNKANELSTKGVKVNLNNVEEVVRVYFPCACMDTIARAPAQGFILFHGLCGCGWCLNPGVWVEPSNDEDDSDENVAKKGSVKKKELEQGNSGNDMKIDHSKEKVIDSENVEKDRLETENGDRVNFEEEGAVENVLDNEAVLMDESRNTGAEKRHSGKKALDNQDLGERDVEMENAEKRGPTNKGNRKRKSGERVVRQKGSPKGKQRAKKKRKKRRRGGSRKYIMANEPAELRTNEKTVKTMHELATRMVQAENDVVEPIDGILRPSMLLGLKKFNIIRGVVPDYMHQSNMGLGKQFTKYWIDYRGKPYSLPPHAVDIIDALMAKVKVPNQLCRLSRSIRHRKWWTAREWENWILYYSIPVLSAFPKFKKFLEHWTLYVRGLYLILKKEVLRTEVEEADNLFRKFAELTEIYYGKEAMTYNLHQLLHLAQSVFDWGPAWAHSGYSFEHGIGVLVQNIHAPRGVIHQLTRTLSFQETVRIMTKEIAPSARTSVTQFLLHLDGHAAKHTKKISEIRYLGHSMKTPEKWINSLNLSQNSEVFKKIVKDRCLFDSGRTERARSDNSFAITKYGQYIRLLDFILDEENKKELTICNSVTVQDLEFETSVHMKRITKISSEEISIETGMINRICVALNVDSVRYICVVPHPHHYW